MISWGFLKAVRFRFSSCSIPSILHLVKLLGHINQMLVTRYRSGEFNSRLLNRLCRHT